MLPPRFRDKPRVPEETGIAKPPHGVRFDKAALDRLQGESLLQAGALRLGPGVCPSDSRPQALNAQAEAGFLQTLDVAHRQRAKS